MMKAPSYSQLERPVWLFAVPGLQSEQEVEP